MDPRITEDLIVVERTLSWFKAGYKAYHHNGNLVHFIEDIGGGMSHKIRISFYGDRNDYADISLKMVPLFPSAEISFKGMPVATVIRQNYPIKYILDYKDWSFSPTIDGRGYILDGNNKAVADIWNAGYGKYTISLGKNGYDVYLPFAFAFAAMHLDRYCFGKYDTY